MGEIDRPLNVVLRHGSPAHEAYTARAGTAHGRRAPGFHSDKKDNLKYFGGHTITDLVFTSRYLGGFMVWQLGSPTSLGHSTTRSTGP